MTETCVPHEAVKPVELPALAVRDTETTLNEVPEISQLRETGALVEIDRREKQEEEKLDGQTETEAIKAGAPCGAEDRNPATAADGERSRVRFSVYRNEEDMAGSPSAAEQNSQLQAWKPGSRCRAVYSADGLVYPAVVLWVKDQRCRVRYDEYNNEEELDVGSLLHPNELRGPSRTAAVTKCKYLGKPVGAGQQLDSQFSQQQPRLEEMEERREQRRQRTREDVHPERRSKRVGSKNENKVEKETAEKRKGDPTNNFFPPFPPQIGSVSPLSFIPPPPPPLPPAWSLHGKEVGDCPDVSAVTNMFMLWYMCGFHTGSFLAQQRSTPPSKD